MNGHCPKQLEGVHKKDIPIVEHLLTLNNLFDDTDIGDSRGTC